ncbi:MAG: MSHA biogenesis protein MshI [Burkholderiales bacterium RIFCSPLOWO2_02_FULL_57_36]|nr:MAG: MSHA biogenesis protein MshI [Burkholderiales bacterium RIFCSPLOWO2_02_FULL_57_36]
MSQQINLFNPIFLKTKKYFSTIAMAQSLGLLLLGSALVAGYAHYQVASLSKEAAVTSERLADAQMQLVRIQAENAPRQKSQALENQVAKAELEMRSLSQVFNILQKGDIGNTKGYSEYLRAFSRQIVDGVWLTGLTLVGAGNEIGVDGRALQPESVATYMNRLKREPVLQGKSFGTLQMQVPQAEQVGKADTTDAKQRGLAGYIEFSLH